MISEGTSESDVVLSTEMLGKSFGGLRAVRDVSISLRRGELHAVIGPNGAGKSTLVNLLAGELQPSSGRILLEGVDITARPVHARASSGIARSFQRTNLLASLTAHENVRLAAQAVTSTTSGISCRSSLVQSLSAKATSALVRAGFSSAHDRVVGTLAHGQQRQLEIAMTLAGTPKVLLLDEPLAGMGPEEGQRMADLVRSLASEYAVLLIEHDMDFVFRVADRLTVMVEGAVLATGLPVDVRANSAVQAAYLGGPVQ